MKRDEKKCVYCGAKGKKSKLEAHHIIYKRTQVKLALKENNGCILCRNCHKELHRLNPIKYGRRKKLWVSDVQNVIMIWMCLQHVIWSVGIVEHIWIVLIKVIFGKVNLKVFVFLQKPGHLVFVLSFYKSHNTFCVLFWNQDLLADHNFHKMIMPTYKTKQLLSI